MKHVTKWKPLSRVRTDELLPGKAANETDAWRLADREALWRLASAFALRPQPNAAVARYLYRMYEALLRDDDALVEALVQAADEAMESPARGNVIDMLSWLRKAVRDGS